MRFYSWLLLPLLFFTSAAVSDQNKNPDSNFISLQAIDIPFEAFPGVEGLSHAVLSGDPERAGTYVIRLRISPGLTFPPHYHDQDRHVTVISGIWAFGTGYSGKCEDTVPLAAGAYVMHPKGAVHFDGACGKEPVEVQIEGLGPVSTTWIEDTK